MKVIKTPKSHKQLALKASTAQVVLYSFLKSQNSKRINNNDKIRERVKKSGLNRIKNS